MSKSKKKKKVKKVKKYAHKSGVEDRVKAIAKIESPDETPFHQDNEKNLERFAKFNRPLRDDRLTIRQKKQKQH